MSQTILITGASSGIGKAAATLFADRGWNVVATMRNTDDGASLAGRDNVLITTLDLLDSESITKAVAEGVDRFGAIDVLLNNAGYGAYGPLEATPMTVLRRQFDVNVFGLVETIQAVLPSMRAQRSGVIINISSVGGRMTFPLGSLYHGSKWAVEGLSEALHFELAMLGIRVKLVEPGGVNTDFGGRSFVFTQNPEFPDYQPLVDMATAALQEEASDDNQEPHEVAEVIFAAATDGTDQTPLHLRRRSSPAPGEPLLGRTRRAVRRRDASPVRALTASTAVRAGGCSTATATPNPARRAAPDIAPAPGRLEPHSTARMCSATCSQMCELRREVRPSRSWLSSIALPDRELPVRDPLEGLTATGLIRTGASRERIPDRYVDLLDVAAARIRTDEPDASVYLYGSVATGTARSPQSDVDLLTVGVSSDRAASIGRALSTEVLRPLSRRGDRSSDGRRLPKRRRRGIRRTSVPSPLLRPTRWPRDRPCHLAVPGRSARSRAASTATSLDTSRDGVKGSKTLTLNISDASSHARRCSPSAVL